MSSAQVKSCLLLAGLKAEGVTLVREPQPSRDHSERMLRAFGAPLHVEPDGTVVVERLLRPLSLPARLRIPGDPSSAAFFVGGALLVPNGSVVCTEVDLNATRTGFLRVLARMGADVRVEPGQEAAGDPVGTLHVRPGGRLLGTTILPAEVPSLLDEVPLLAVVASQAQGVTRLSGAAELRVKESDRLRQVCQGLRAMGAEVEETPDGFVLQGPTRPQGDAPGRLGRPPPGHGLRGGRAGGGRRDPHRRGGMGGRLLPRLLRRARGALLRGSPVVSRAGARYAVVGDPVAHSASPRLFAALAARLGLPLEYRAERVTALEFQDFLGRVRGGAYQGVSVTLPHKESALWFADSASESARATGAANTLTRGEGRLLRADNTDGVGLVRALAEHGVTLAGARVLVLGAGGAARAAAQAARAAGARTLLVANRTAERAERLAEAFGGVAVPLSAERPGSRPAGRRRARPGQRRRPWAPGRDGAPSGLRATPAPHGVGHGLPALGDSAAACRPGRRRTLRRRTVDAHPPGPGAAAALDGDRGRARGGQWRCTRSWRGGVRVNRRLRFLTAGESHGPALLGILEGLPAGPAPRGERH